MKRIAVCITRMDESVQTECLKTIANRCDALGYGLQVLNTFEELANNDLYDEGEKSIFKLLSPDLIDAIILFPEKIKDNELNKKIISFAKENGLPIVCIDRDVEGVHSITYTYEKNFEEIVEHLVTKHNCKKFFMMAGFEGNSFSEERIEATRKVLAKHGLSLEPEDIGYGNFWEEPCREVMHEYLQSGRPLPDAFVSANDTMAVTILYELFKAGYHVPEDVLVTGFDGIDVVKHIVPRITTAEQNNQVGMEKAIDFLHASLNGKEESQHLEEVPFDPKFAHSCGCEPVGEANSLFQIMDLYNESIHLQALFKYSYELQTAMTAEKNMLDLIGHLPEKLFLLKGVTNLSIIVEPKVLENDDKIQKILAERGQSNVFRDKDKLIVLAQLTKDGNFEQPLTVFGRKEVLPEYSIQEKIAQNKMIFVPLHMQDYVVGYMVMNLDVSEHDFFALNNISRVLGYCINELRVDQKVGKVNEKLKQANDKLEDLYVRDSLTNIFNRRGFFTELRPLLKKKKGGVSMISVDLDRLKYINDTFGHSEGDYAIRAVATALKDSIGENGLCARFGGDEFSAALFDSVDIDEAVEKWEREFQACLEVINETSGKEYPIGASYGVASAIIEEGLNVDQLLNAADDRMYELKQEHHRVAQKSRKEARNN